MEAQSIWIVDANPSAKSKIFVGFKSQDGDICYYRVEPQTMVETLLEIYCKKKNFEQHDVVFIHNGARIQPTMTFTQAGIKDWDQIDAMVHQNGGGYSG